MVIFISVNGKIMCWSVALTSSKISNVFRDWLVMGNRVMVNIIMPMVIFIRGIGLMI